MSFTAECTETFSTDFSPAFQTPSARLKLLEEKKVAKVVVLVRLGVFCMLFCFGL